MTQTTTTQAVLSEPTTEIRAVLADLLAAWQRRDIPGYLAHLDEDVDVVNRGGKWLAGKAAFAEQLEWMVAKGFPEIFTAEHTTESVRIAANGVAVAHELRVEPNRRSRAVYVLTERDSGWRVASISISPIEPPRDPGLRA
ncbi:YybH family protein [Solihabitans fulvus]|nr:nuclear transport factor 2 family protein [Solihabitans fulvus]